MLMLLSAALAVKVGEMLSLSTLPTVRHGRSWAEKFHQDYKAFRGRVAVKNHVDHRHRKMVLNRWLARYSSVLANYVYRWPILVATLAIALVLSAKLGIPQVLCMTSGFALFTALVVTVFHEVVDRLVMGVASNVHLSPFTNVVQVDYASVSWITSEVLRRVAVSFIVHIGAIWFSFSSLYYLAVVISPGSLEKAESLVDCLYFSLVALTTTGFGDIFPKKDLVKLMVGSQLAMSWILTVVMIFHYGATLSFDLDTEASRDDT